MLATKKQGNVQKTVKKKKANFIRFQLAYRIHSF